MSSEHLLREAEASGFRTDVLEKAIHLLNLLEGFRAHPFLKDRLVLKGGTAINLFVCDSPRLSVDIDLNYVGTRELERMLAERPRIEQAVEAVCLREGFAIRRSPQAHAGGKWLLRCQSVAGGHANLEVDLNFMYRVPLWPATVQNSRAVGSHAARAIPVIDLHELAAGKLTALLARHTSRDLFDAHQLLTEVRLDRERLRVAFVAYGAMNRRDWRTVSTADVSFDPEELTNHLLPMLRMGFLEDLGRPATWAARLVEECRQALSVVLPLSEAELAFLDRLLDHGELVPSVLTADEQLAQRIGSHPALEWKAVNVRQCKG